MIAIPGGDRLHVAKEVKFCVAKLDSVAVAENCRVVPRTIVALKGVTEIDLTSADVSDVDPVIPLNVAVIVEVPAVTAEARPLLTVATASDDCQAADWVRSWVAKSCKVPIAANFWVVPGAIVGSAGVTVIETSGEKVRTAEPVISPDEAVILVEPVLAGVELTSPVRSTAAIAGSAEVQVTFSFSLRFVLFANVPIASSCIFVPGAMLGFVGVTAIETRADDANDVAGEEISMFSGLQAGKKRWTRITAITITG